MKKRKSKKSLSELEPVEFVLCPMCGNEQSDMGNNVQCEECRYGPMPSPSSARAKELRGECSG